jgi:hypothetical protein
MVARWDACSSLAQLAELTLRTTKCRMALLTPLIQHLDSSLHVCIC